MAVGTSTFRTQGCRPRTGAAPARKKARRSGNTGEETIYASGGRVTISSVSMWEVYGELCGVLRFWLRGDDDASEFDVGSARGLGVVDGSEDSGFAELDEERLLLADVDGCRLDGLSGYRWAGVRRRW